MLTTDEALISLGTATAGATVEALRAVVGEDEVSPGAVSAIGPGRDPFADAELPTAVAAASFASGARRLLLMPEAVAQRLAGTEAELTDSERAELAEKLRPTFEAAAVAASATLDTEYTIEQLDVTIARSARDLRAEGSFRGSQAEISIFGTACRLIGLVPAELLSRIAHDDPGAGQGDAVREALSSTLRDVQLRVWAEVGRARLRSAEVASLGDGAIVELDRAADDPVDLYVNGSRIATGRLECIDGKEWAVRLEEVFPSAEADAAAA